MKKITKINLREIPLEDAHGGSGKKQVLINSDHLESAHWDGFTKGYLQAGGEFDWHSHENIDEVFIVISGEGIFRNGDESTTYERDDVVRIPANSKHKIEAATDSEFYFVRVKV